MFAIGGRIYLVSDDFAAAIEKLAELSKSLKGRIRTEQAAAPTVVKKLFQTVKNLENAASSLSGSHPATSRPVPRTETLAEPRSSWLRAQVATGSTTLLQIIGQILLALAHHLFHSGLGLHAAPQDAARIGASPRAAGFGEANSVAILRAGTAVRPYYAGHQCSGCTGSMAGFLFPGI